jgi:protein involved in polysaccharide export with SLBB domain
MPTQPSVVKIGVRGLAMRIAHGIVFGMILAGCLACSGCHALDHHDAPPDVPRENNKKLLGDYIINPPDVLVLDLIRAVPLPPYKIRPLDLLYINVRGTPAEDPIKGVFRVEPDGIIRLGPAYGSLPVVDLSIEEAIKDITKHLKTAGNLKDPTVSLSLEETRGVQLIRGEHLVRPDGSVNLGFYGRVTVGGMNQEAAKAAIEEHLSQYFLKPKISIDIGGFNSSVYYIIFDGGGAGEQVVRLSLPRVEYGWRGPPATIPTSKYLRSTGAPSRARAAPRRIIRFSRATGFMSGRCRSSSLTLCSQGSWRPSSGLLA